MTMYRGDIVGKNVFLILILILFVFSFLVHHLRCFSSFLKGYLLYVQCKPMNGSRSMICLGLSLVLIDFDDDGDGYGDVLMGISYRPARYCYYLSFDYFPLSWVHAITTTVRLMLGFGCGTWCNYHNGSI